jgi:putative CocE/NonD family hydrolase
MALTGWLISDSLPAKVKTLYLGHYSVDRCLSAYKEGLFRHDVLTGWAMENAGKKVDADYIKSALYRPHINVDEELWSIRLDWYRKWITSTDYNSEYWHTGVWKTLREMPGKIKIPVCIVAGWYDHHLEGTLLGYQELCDETRAMSRLVIGAWNHSREACVPAHNPHNANLDRISHMLEWFDRIMLEEKEPDAGVSAYFIGDDRWRELNDWPIKNTCKRNLYLSTVKRNDVKAFKLDIKEQAKSELVRYDYDPENPVYTHGGETLLVTQNERGSLLQQEPGYREDVISFVSETLTEDIRIGGKMNVKLYVSSDCEDTCFTARIMEVLPNGEAYNIRSTVATLAYRNNSSERLEYNPGDIAEINIELLPVAWNIKAGSSVRVDISSSSFPEYSVHSNYPGIWSLQEKTRVARQTLHIGGIYHSCLEIPVIKEY